MIFFSSCYDDNRLTGIGIIDKSDTDKDKTTSKSNDKETTVASSTSDTDSDSSEDLESFLQKNPEVREIIKILERKI